MSRANAMQQNGTNDETVSGPCREREFGHTEQIRPSDDASAHLMPEKRGSGRYILLVLAFEHSDFVDWHQFPSEPCRVAKSYCTSPANINGQDPF